MQLLMWRFPSTSILFLMESGFPSFEILTSDSLPAEDGRINWSARLFEGHKECQTQFMPIPHAHYACSAPVFAKLIDILLGSTVIS